MYKSKMAFIVHRDQVVVIVIDLTWRQLAFVDDVFVAQRAEIEPIVQTDGMSCPLTKYIKLAFKLFLVESFWICDLRLFAIPVS